MLEKPSVIRPVLEAGLNRIKLATFRKHGEEAQSAARGVMQSAARRLAERHYRLEDELPHVAGFVAGSLRYPYYLDEEKMHRQFTPNFYRTAGVIELVARDFMLRHAFGVDSQHAADRTVAKRRAVLRFMDEFYAAGDLSERAVKDLEAALGKGEAGKKRVRQLQQRIPAAEKHLEEVLKKFLAGPRGKPLGRNEEVKRMRLVERLRNSTAYVNLPFMMLELKR